MKFIIIVNMDDIKIEDIYFFLILKFGRLSIKYFIYEQIRFPIEIESKTMEIIINDIKLKRLVCIK